MKRLFKDIKYEFRVIRHRLFLKTGAIVKMDNDVVAEEWKNLVVDVTKKEKYAINGVVRVCNNFHKKGSKIILFPLGLIKEAKRGDVK